MTDRSNSACQTFMVNPIPIPRPKAAHRSTHAGVLEYAGRYFKTW